MDLKRVFDYFAYAKAHFNAAIKLLKSFDDTLYKDICMQHVQTAVECCLRAFITSLGIVSIDNTAKHCLLTLCKDTDCKINEQEESDLYRILEWETASEHITYITVSTQDLYKYLQVAYKFLKRNGVSTTLYPEITAEVMHTIWLKVESPYEVLTEFQCNNLYAIYRYRLCFEERQVRKPYIFDVKLYYRIRDIDIAHEEKELSRIRAVTGLIDPEDIRNYMEQEYYSLLLDESKL